jgi:hypothetical protein
VPRPDLGGIDPGRTTHGEHSRCLSTAAVPNIDEKSGTVARRMRRVIADPQALAQARDRFDVVLAHACNEPVDRVAVPAGRIVLFRTRNLRRQREAVCHR